MLLGSLTGGGGISDSGDVSASFRQNFGGINGSPLRERTLEITLAAVVIAGVLGAVAFYAMKRRG